ncbi:hypothetical protein Z949_2575 [Sulfitobacter guttiformis KCTC 32187]|nr:hypothetical protein Z949_2575 [Sulfitobacter guttiformis KCTC 32187]
MAFDMWDARGLCQCAAGSARPAATVKMPTFDAVNLIYLAQPSGILG